MRFLLILTVGICLLFPAVPVMAQSAADESAVREATKQYMAAFNKNDVKAMLALLDEKCEPWLGDYKGKAAFEKRWEMRIAQSPNRKVKLTEEIGIVFLSPDFAIHKFLEEYSGWHDEDGKPGFIGGGLRK
jgi:ketosteroid isomerase-like protein